MRRAITPALALCGALLLGVQSCALAQGAEWDLRTSYLRVQGKLLEPEEVVLRSYLQRRLEMTGVIPELRICARLPEVTHAAGFWRALIAKGYATSITADPNCPSSADRMPATKDGGVVWLLRGVFTRDSSVLDAFASKVPSQRQGIYVPAHAERFYWNHRRDVGGHELTFFGFRQTDN